MSTKRLLLPLLTHLARPTPLSTFLPPAIRLHNPHPHPQPHLHHPYTTTTRPPPPPNPLKEPKSYTFEEIQHLVTTTTTTTRPTTLLIDVREPAELSSTGRIPGAVNLPLASHPDAFWLGDAEFRDRFGFARPRASPSSSVDTETVAAEGEGDRETGNVEEVVFYCKAGVRSRAAARLAQGAWGKEKEGGGGVRVGEYRGSWVEWVGRGGGVER